VPIKKKPDAISVAADLHEWRVHVNERIAAINDQMAENTRLTAEHKDETKREFKALRDEVKPVTDAVSTMSAGIRTIGRLSSITIATGKAALVVVAVWAGFRLLVSGASWQEVLAAFWKAMK